MTASPSPPLEPPRRPSRFGLGVRTEIAADPRRVPRGVGCRAQCLLEIRPDIGVAAGIGAYIGLSSLARPSVIRRAVPLRQAIADADQLVEQNKEWVKN